MPTAIPIELRSRMPSLASAYEELSMAVHSADANSAIYERVREEILTHFEIRKVHKLLDGPKPNPSKS